MQLGNERDVIFFLRADSSTVDTQGKQPENFGLTDFGAVSIYFNILLEHFKDHLQRNSLN